MMEALVLYLGEIENTNSLINGFGFDLFSENQTNNFRAYILLFDLIVFNVIEFHSSYSNRENFNNFVFAMMSWPFAMMVTKKEQFIQN